MRLAQYIPNSFRQLPFSDQLDQIRLVRRLRRTNTKVSTPRKTRIAAAVKKTKKVEASLNNMKLADIQALLARLEKEIQNESARAAEPTGAESTPTDPAPPADPGTDQTP